MTEFASVTQIVSPNAITGVSADTQKYVASLLGDINQGVIQQMHKGGNLEIDTAKLTTKVQGGEQSFEARVSAGLAALKSGHGVGRA